MKLAYKLFNFIFFSIIIIPLLLMPWSQNTMVENRVPAPLPKTIDDEGKINLSLPTEIEDYFRDRFAGRTKMIDAYGRVLGSFFHVSANDKVIYGRDGWLFFDETVADYDGTAALDDLEFETLVSYLLENKHAIHERGQVFILLIVPNKNTMYGEHMPDYIHKGENPTNLDRLFEIFELECIDLRGLFEQSEDLLYYKTDTHWNGLGARIAAREIMLQIEEKTGISTDVPVVEYEYESVLVPGDLGKMLYPANPPQEPDRQYVDLEQNYRYIGRFRTFDDLNITTESDGTHLSIAMYRDSFASALIPYLSNAYSNVYYTRQTPAPLDSAAFKEADVIIYQIVERRLPELIK